MPDLSRLQAIQTFPMLVNYLRDELEWPITPHDFEDLTFEYQPEELGIEKKYTNLIKNIRQLRPLTTNQPWGVFFINFDKEKLPVVMLRRILGALVVKKRASGQSFNRPSWLCNDLLFISTYGEETSRSISFGHFREREVGGLPTLRVVGWDKDSTQLRMEDAQLRLAERLRYPEDTSDLENWRETWSSAFKLRPREVITTSKALATRLAEIAQSIRQSVGTILEIETENGPMRELLKSFQENLLHDLTEDGFADTYAQTLTYGLLSEKMIASLEGTSGSLASIKLTNPFLSELVDQCRAVGREQQQIDFDELGVGELEELLDNQDTKLDEVLKDFGRTATGEDPVLHFYELFLSEYNPQDRKQKGVFYTPKPVVSYIVRSVHELLQTEFGLDDGLADTTTWGEMIRKNPEIKLPPLTDKLGEKRTISEDEPFVQILDPATGTATFLVETIDVIHKAMIKRWESEGKFELEQLQLWNEYVPKHLLPRLHGYELMMAPYAIAHMKIGIKLYETGYRFKAKERARIYLTNALEPAQDFSGTLAFAIPALAHEAEAVNAIKRDQRFTVVIGNPPYSNFGQQNKNVFILKLLADFKKGLEEKKLNLDDDFIKFIRLFQYTVDEAGAGAVGVITNNAYIDGITHRRMRKSLMESFGDVCILDLHGSAKKREQGPDGAREENVFEIQQGVAISLLLKVPDSTGNSTVRHSELWGSRESKYQSLSAMSPQTMKCSELTPCPEAYFFAPKDLKESDEYQSFWSLDEIMMESISGVQSKKDSLFVDFDRSPVEQRLTAFLDPARRSSSPELAEILGPRDDWLVRKARGVEYAPDAIRRISLSPLNQRAIYYEPKILGRARYSVMRHMQRPNFGLVFMRQSANQGQYDHALAVGGLVTDRVFYSANGAPFLAPLYLYADEGEPDSTLFDGHAGGRESNLSQRFVDSLMNATSSVFHQQGKQRGAEWITPEDVFDYIYAVLYGPQFRRRYEVFLKIDFPRIPIPGSRMLFDDLARLGRSLVSLHLLEKDGPDPRSKIIGDAGDLEVEKVSYSDGTVWIDKAKTRGFKGVPEEVWNFHIGGYQVCEKWLKDRQAKGGKNPRPGRVLTDEDIEHYQKIVVALSETIRIMAEIDEVIEAHGGWPNAFQPKDSNE